MGDVIRMDLDGLCDFNIFCGGNNSGKTRLMNIIANTMVSEGVPIVWLNKFKVEEISITTKKSTKKESTLIQTLGQEYLKKGKILFLDDLPYNYHHSVYEPIIESLFTLVYERGVPVFMSTHSLEFLIYIVRYLERTENTFGDSRVSCYTCSLEKADETIHGDCDTIKSVYRDETAFIKDLHKVRD